MAAQSILIPMDADGQTNHLKAYGIAFWVLDQDVSIHWLLNYRGGAFLFPHLKAIEEELVIRGVKYEILADGQVNEIKRKIGNPETNMEVVQLEKAPKIAVYTPNGKMPWDDAVTLVLDYAEIPYDKIYDSAIVNGVLPKYDWLHLHHEDFTGQYGRFYKNFHTHAWYRENKNKMEALAQQLGYAKVSELKLSVVKKIREYVVGGGFMFAMCSATDTYDIALAAEGIDICDYMYDGDGADPNAQSKLDYSKTFAFKDFKLVKDPFEYEYSQIDNYKGRNVTAKQDYFNLFDFSAKWDPVPTILTQNHTRTVKGFMGQTTAYRKKYIKSDVLILGENKPAGEVRYIHGTYGKGTWSFYGGHDPEDYRHYVEDPETDLNLHPNSPGYRLILNNVLFPAAKKKKKKT